MALTHTTDDRHALPTFGEWLKRQRRLLDFTRDELSQRVHCSPDTIKKIEGEERAPSKELAGLIADALGVDAGEREGFIRFARGQNPEFARRDVPIPSSSAPVLKATPALAPALMTTKLFVPPLRPGLVQRPRLIALLRQGLARRLTLISASAGFGKTTLAAYLADLRDDCIVAWLSLDEDDNDPKRFLEYLIHACKRLDKDSDRIAWSDPVAFGAMALAMLHTPQPLSHKAVITSLINDLTQLDPGGRQIMIVLDDYHVLSAQAVHDACAYLLDSLPTHVHLVITTRADPPLPLSRLRARNDLLEIRINELRFTLDETTDFFGSAQLQPGEIAALEARTEGWAAGLQLAALSMQGMQRTSDRSTFIRAFSGSNRYVVDYLVEETLARLPDETQTFLLRTSILDRFCASLCAAVIGDWRLETGDSSQSLIPNLQSLLEHIERSNLFLIPLDHERIWYRYHHLFRDVLRHRLQRSMGAEGVAELQTHASDWCARNDLVEEAIQYALTAQDFDRAARVMAGNTHAVVARGELSKLVRWGDLLPMPALCAHAELALLVCYCRAMLGDYASAGLLLDALDHSGVANTDATRGMADVPRAFLAMMTQNDGRRAFVLLQQALELLPEECVHWRRMATALLSGTYFMVGDIPRATASFQHAADLALRAGDFVMAASTLFELGKFHVSTGDLHESERVYRQAIQIVQKWGGDLHPMMISGWVGLAEVLYYGNRLGEAAAYADQARALAEPARLALFAVPALTLLARMHGLRGEMDMSQDFARRADALMRDMPQNRDAVHSWWRGWLMRVEGKDAEAMAWVSEVGMDATSPLTVANSNAYCTVALVFAVRGKTDSNAQVLRDAMHMFDQALALAAPMHAAGMIMLCEIGRALVFEAQGNRVAALASLDRAVGIAERGGWVRPFLDAGADMRPLLLALQSERSMHEMDSSTRAFVDMLIAAPR